MASWIPGPERYCWPANRKRYLPESPHQAAMGEPKEEPKPRRRRTTKPAD